MKHKKVWIIPLIIVFLIIATSIHFKKSPHTKEIIHEPLHFDEWIIASVSKELTSTQTISKLNQFTPLPDTKNDWYYKQGQAIILSELKFLNINIINSFFTISTLFIILSGLTLFAYLKTITKNKITLIFGSFFFIFSNTSFTHILGKNYFVPSSFAIFGFYLYLYFNQKKSYLQYITILFELLIHPNFASILILHNTITTTIPIWIKTNMLKKWLKLALTTIAIVTATISTILLKKEIFYTFFNKQYFSYTMVSANTDTISHIGVIAIIILTAGLLITLSKQNWTKYLNLNILTLLVTLQIITSITLNLSIINQYNRLINILILLIPIYATIFAEFMLKNNILQMLKIQTLKYKAKYVEYTKYIILATVMIIIISQHISFTNNIKEHPLFVQNKIQYEDISKYLNENFQSNARILANPDMSKYIYTTTNLQTIQPPTHFSTNKYSQNISSIWNHLNCDEKIELASVLETGLAIDSCDLRCNDINKIKQIRNFCIYSIKNKNTDIAIIPANPNTKIIYENESIIKIQKKKIQQNIRATIAIIYKNTSNLTIFGSHYETKTIRIQEYLNTANGQSTYIYKSYNVSNFIPIPLLNKSYDSNNIGILTISTDQISQNIQNKININITRNEKYLIKNQ